MFEILAVG